MSKNNDSIILIIGGSGFIGGAIVKYLLNNYKKNKILFPTRKECDLENKNSILSYTNPLKNEKLKVIFCASIVRKKNNTLLSMNKNIELVDNFINSLVINNLVSLIFMSSIDVYDTSMCKKFTEESLLLPSSYYGLSKIYNEYSIKEKLKKTNTTILRLPGVYGEDKNSLIDMFIDRIYCNTIIDLENEGKNLRDFLFIDDLCEVINELLINPTKEVFNVASGKSISVIKIIKHIEEALHKKANLKRKTNLYNNNDILISNKKIKKHFSNLKFTTIYDGIQKLVNKKEK